jgi:hypothetical protein
MSKLIDILHKLAQAAPSPMGFRTSKPTEAVNKILIIGRMAVNSAPPTKGNIAADAVLVYADAEATAQNVQKTAKALGDIPWGIYLEESGVGTAALIEAGADFVVFSPSSFIPDLPENEKTGKILQADSSMDDGLLRTVNDLPADALLITDTFEDNKTLTMHQLMIYRHLANFVAKPLIVPVPTDITLAELKALQDAEIDAVIAEIDGDGLKELRKTISKLPPRAAKKPDKGGVILPRMSAGAAKPAEEEEEEDE